MAPRAGGAIETHAWRDGRTVTVRARRARLRPALPDRLRHEPRGLERRAGARRTRPHPAAGRARHLGAAQAGTENPSDARRRRDRPRDRVALVAAPQGRAGANTELDYKLAARPRAAPPRARRTAELDAHRVDTSVGELEAAACRRVSVNMVLDLLAQVLDDAVEYGLLDANPARGKRRRMKVPKSAERSSSPTWSSTCSTSRGDWERELPEHQRYGRRAFLARYASPARGSPNSRDPRGRLDLHAGRLELGKKTDGRHRPDLELSARSSR